MRCVLFVPWNVGTTWKPTVLPIGHRNMVSLSLEQKCVLTVNNTIHVDLVYGSRIFLRNIGNTV
jgi:hypothetical protein